MKVMRVEGDDGVEVILKVELTNCGGVVTTTMSVAGARELAARLLRAAIDTVPEDER